MDTGLQCLISIAAHYGIPTDLNQLSRAYVVEGKNISTIEIMRAARDMKLKVRLLQKFAAERLNKINFPAIVSLNNGNYIILLQVQNDKVLIFDPSLEQKTLLIDKKIFLKNWKNEIVLFTKRFILQDKIRKFGVQWFFPVIEKYKKFLIQVLGLSLLLQLLGLIAPLFTQVIIDKVLVHRSVKALDVLLGGMILLAIFENWMQGLRTYVFSHTTNKIDVTLGSHLFKSVINLPISYFEKWQVGEVVSRMKELDNIRSFLTGSSLTIIMDIVFAIVYLIVMFVYSLPLSCIALIVIPAFLCLNAIVAPMFKKRINDQFLISAENHSFLIEMITGMRTLKSMAMEHQSIKKYEEILARYIKAVFSVTNLGNISGNIGLFLQQSFNLAILWLGSYYVIDNKITVGQLIAFQMLASQVIAPILRLVNSWQSFQQVRVSLDRVGDIMNEETEPMFNPNRTTLAGIKGEIVFDQVDFRYTKDGNTILQNISIGLPAGIKIGIVGKSGSGKSTLTKLIQRLYLPEKGRILIDGVDLAQVEPAWLRRQIGVVLQENFLFGGTIKENISIANPNATDEQIIQAAKLAGAHDFIEELPHKYDNFVGERGSLLSGGQRQRISIARALLLDPKILIFDEATSALDYESEKLIINNLDQISKGRTTILIAHRLSTIIDCQVIIVMDKGHIVEIGNHDQLMSHKGYYYNLYSQQN